MEATVTGKTAILEREGTAQDGADREIDMAPDSFPVRDMGREDEYAPQATSIPTLDALVQEGQEALPEVTVPAPAQERPAVRAAQEVVQNSGVAMAGVQRLTLQLGVLRDGGIFGDVDTSGANSLMMAVNLEEAGAWRSTEKDVKRRLVERNPQVSVLPQYWVARLRTPLANARAALNDHSYRFPVTDAFIGPSFRFIPYTQWQEFITAYRKAQEDLEAVKEELLVPEAYREAVDAVLQQAMQRAEHAAKSLEANGTPVKDDFIPRFVDRVQGRIPTQAAIRSKLTIGFTPGILGDEADLLDYDTRIAEANTARRLAEANRDAIAETKASMRLFVLESLKERLSTSLAPFDQMLQAFKAEAYRTLVSVRECLTTEQHLDRAAVRKLEHLFTELGKIKEFLGDEFTETKLDGLTASVVAFGTASARTESPLLAGQLETLLADMQALCRDAAMQATPEDTGISAGAL